MAWQVTENVLKTLVNNDNINNNLTSEQRFLVDTEAVLFPVKGSTSLSPSSRQKSAVIRRK